MSYGFDEIASVSDEIESPSGSKVPFDVLVGPLVHEGGQTFDVSAAVGTGDSGYYLEVGGVLGGQDKGLEIAEGEQPFDDAGGKGDEP